MMLSVRAKGILIALILVFIASSSSGQSSSSVSDLPPLPSQPHFSGDGSLHVESSTNGITNSHEKTSSLVHGNYHTGQISPSLLQLFKTNSHADIFTTKRKQLSSSHSPGESIGQRLPSVRLSSLDMTKLPPSPVLNQVNSRNTVSWSLSLRQLNRGSQTGQISSQLKITEYPSSQLDVSPRTLKTGTSVSSSSRIKTHSVVTLQPSPSIRYSPSTVSHTPPLSIVPTSHFVSTPPPLRRNTSQIDITGNPLSSRVSSGNDSNKITGVLLSVLPSSKSGQGTSLPGFAENSVDSFLSLHHLSSVLSHTNWTESFSLSLSQISTTFLNTISHSIKSKKSSLPSLFSTSSKILVSSIFHVSWLDTKHSFSTFKPQSTMSDLSKLLYQSADREPPNTFHLKSIKPTPNPSFSDILNTPFPHKLSTPFARATPTPLKGSPGLFSASYLQSHLIRPSPSFAIERSHSVKVLKNSSMMNFLNSPDQNHTSQLSLFDIQASSLVSPLQRSSFSKLAVNAIDSASNLLPTITYSMTSHISSKSTLIQHTSLHQDPSSTRMLKPSQTLSLSVSSRLSFTLSSYLPQNSIFSREKTSLSPLHLTSSSSQISFFRSQKLHDSSSPVMTIFPESGISSLSKSMKLYKSQDQTSILPSSAITLHPSHTLRLDSIPSVRSLTSSLKTMPLFRMTPVYPIGSVSGLSTMLEVQTVSSDQFIRSSNFVVTPKTTPSSADKTPSPMQSVSPSNSVSNIPSILFSARTEPANSISPKSTFSSLKFSASPVKETPFPPLDSNDIASLHSSSSPTIPTTSHASSSHKSHIGTHILQSDSTSIQTPPPSLLSATSAPICSVSSSLLLSTFPFHSSQTYSPKTSTDSRKGTVSYPQTVYSEISPSTVLPVSETPHIIESSALTSKAFLHHQTTSVQFTSPPMSFLSSKIVSTVLPTASLQYPLYSTTLKTQSLSLNVQQTHRPIPTLLPSYTTHSVKSDTATSSIQQTLTSGSPTLVGISGSYISETVTGSSISKASSKLAVSVTDSKTLVSKTFPQSSVDQSYSPITLSGSFTTPSGSSNSRNKFSFTRFGTSVAGIGTSSAFGDPSISHSSAPFTSGGSSFVYSGSLMKNSGSSLIHSGSHIFSSGSSTTTSGSITAYTRSSAIGNGFSNPSIISGSSIVHTKYSSVYSESFRFNSGLSTFGSGSLITHLQSSFLNSGPSIGTIESPTLKTAMGSYISRAPIPSSPNMPQTSNHFSRKHSQAHPSFIFISSTKISQGSSSPLPSSVIAVPASHSISLSSTKILPFHPSVTSPAFVLIPNYTSTYSLNDATTFLTSLVSLSTVAPTNTTDAFVSMGTESPSSSLTTSRPSLAITSSSSSPLPSVSNISITTFSSHSQNLSSTVASSQSDVIATSVFTETFPTTYSTPHPVQTTLAPSYKPSSSQVYTTPELPSTTLATWITSLITGDLVSMTTVPMESKSLLPTSSKLPPSDTITVEPTNASVVTTLEPLITTPVPNNASVVTTDEPLLPTSPVPVQPTNQSITNDTRGSTTQGNATVTNVTSTTEGAITEGTTTEENYNTSGTTLLVSPVNATNTSVVTTQVPLLPTSPTSVPPTNQSMANDTRGSTTQGNTTLTRITSTTEGAITEGMTTDAFVSPVNPTNASVVTTPTSPASVQPTNQSMANDTEGSTTQGNTTMTRFTPATEGTITEDTDNANGTTPLVSPINPTNASLVTTQRPRLPTSPVPAQPTNQSMTNYTRGSTTPGNATITRVTPTTEGPITEDTDNANGTTPLVSPVNPTNASVVTTQRPHLPTSPFPVQTTNQSMTNDTRGSTTPGNAIITRVSSTAEGPVTEDTDNANGTTPLVSPVNPTNASVVTTQRPHLPTSPVPVQTTNQSMTNDTRGSTTPGNAIITRVSSTTEGPVTEDTDNANGTTPLVSPVNPTNASVVTTQRPHLQTSPVPVQTTNQSMTNDTRGSTTPGNAIITRVSSTTEGPVTEDTDNANGTTPLVSPVNPANASVVTTQRPHLPTSPVPVQTTNQSMTNDTRGSTTPGNDTITRVTSTTEGAMTEETTAGEIFSTNATTPLVLPVNPTNVPVVTTQEPLLPTSPLPIQPTNQSMANGTRGSTTEGNTTVARATSTTKGATTEDTTTLEIFNTNGTTTLVLSISPTLDKSFSTMEYWVMMELTVPTETDIRDSDFLSDLETNLAKSYQEARQRELEKENEVKQLLRKLNPEDDIFLRVKRASTVDGSTAQIIDLSRDSEVQTTGELVFYIFSEGASIPALDCATTFTELSLQELTLLMEMVVLSPVTAYNVVPTSPAPSRDTTFIIILSIFIPMACLFCCMCCCCSYCVVCGPKRARNERTMSPDTFKMLEFKQKFPYKPYTPNQTPRANMDYPPSDDEEFLSRSNKRVSVGGVWEESSSTTRIIPEATSLSSSFRLPEKLRVSNRGLESSVRISEPPVASYHDYSDQLEASPSKKDQHLDETATRRLPAPPSSFLSDPNYVASQMEISKILEPENVMDLRKPRKKRRKKTTPKTATLEDPNNETAATGSWVQLPNDTQPEPISETRQKVHALIEEAFSLVNFKGTSSTTVTKLPSQDNGEPPREEAKESKPIVNSHVMDLLTGRKKEFGIQTMQPHEESKVVVVPVHTPSLAETSSVLWNPYTARDELQKISPTREPASLPGDVNSSPPDVSHKLKQTSVWSKELERPHYPEGAEYASSLFKDSSLDHFRKSHEYAVGDRPSSRNNFSTTDSPFLLENDHGSLKDNGSARPLGDTNYLTDLEKERKERTSEYYDELDVTGVLGRGRPSRSLLDSIRAELMGTGRRIGDGKEGTEW